MCSHNEHPRLTQTYPPVIGIARKPQALPAGAESLPFSYCDAQSRTQAPCRKAGPKSGDRRQQEPGGEDRSGEGLFGVERQREACFHAQMWKTLQRERLKK